MVTIGHRRILHRRVGEALAAVPNADPDAVAFHFRQAGDARAAEWLIEAGERAQEACAWLTAADRFEAASFLADAETEEQGWLLVRIARLRRLTDPQHGVVNLELALRLATKKQDRALAAYALFYLGFLHVTIGDIRRGLSEMEAGIAAENALPPADMARLKAQREALGELFSEHKDSTTLVLWFAQVGRYAEAATRGAHLPPPLPASAPTRALYNYPDAYWGLAIVHAVLGRPVEARRAFAHAHAAYHASEEYFLVGQVAVSELKNVILPYETANLAERARLIADIDYAKDWAKGMVGIGESLRLDPLPMLLLEGRWAEVRQSAVAVRAAGGGWLYTCGATVILGTLAHAQGEREFAWRLIREILPNGPATAPGNTSCVDALALQRIAIALACEEGDFEAARNWLHAQDRWLAWSGAVLGQAEGHLAWAMYYREVDDPAAAYKHALQSLAHAAEPEQPLALLAAHHLLGELNTDAAPVYGCSDPYEYCPGPRGRLRRPVRACPDAPRHRCIAHHN